MTVRTIHIDIPYLVLDSTLHTTNLTDAGPVLIKFSGVTDIDKKSKLPRCTCSAGDVLAL